jgi:YggT family protein
MLRSLFYTCNMIISAYSFACLIRILLTWIPQIEYSPVGQFFAAICDPFLNWFRRFPFARIGALDFSPILAIGTLSVASMVFSSLGATGRISIGVVLSSFVQVIWSFFSFFFILVIALLAIRLVYDLFNRYGYSPFWSTIDRFLNHPISYVTSLLNRGRAPMSYRASLILTLITMTVVWLGLGVGVTYLSAFLYKLPF